MMKGERMRDQHGWKEGFRDGITQAILELEEREVSEAIKILRRYREIYRRRVKQEAAQYDDQTASIPFVRVTD